MLRYTPSIPSFIRAFIIKGCWILSKAFSASIQMIMWFLSLLLLMCCITFNDLYILNHCCDETDLIWGPHAKSLKKNIYIFFCNSITLEILRWGMLTWVYNIVYNCLLIIAALLEAGIWVLSGVSHGTMSNAWVLHPSSRFLGLCIICLSFLSSLQL
jgi:hypothetical protein